MTQTTDGSGGRNAAALSDMSTAEQNVIDEVYRRRARRLAARQATATVTQTWSVLVFGLGTERYAIPLSDLAEVLPYRACTAVPGAPPAVVGVVNVRGEIKVVADLRRLLALPAGGDPATGYVLMLRQKDLAIGFKVDRVEQVRQIDPAQLVSASDGGAPIAGSRFAKALTADTVMLLDTAAALAELDPAMTETAKGRL